MKKSGPGRRECGRPAAGREQTRRAMRRAMRGRIFAHVILSLVQNLFELVFRVAQAALRKIFGVVGMSCSIFYLQFTFRMLMVGCSVWKCQRNINQRVLAAASGGKSGRRRCAVKTCRRGDALSGKSEPLLPARVLQARAVGGKKDPAQSRSATSKAGSEQGLKIALHLKSTAAMRARKSWWIKNDDIEFFALFGRRGRTSKTSSAMKRWSLVGRLLSAKFSRPRPSDFFERSMFTVSAPTAAAATEKEQV